MLNESRTANATLDPRRRREARQRTRDAIAIPGWAWMPGMLTDVGERVTDVDAFYLGTLPDLGDPRTLGWIMAWVCGDIAVLTQLSGEWTAYMLNGDAVSAPTVGGVCVAVARARGYWTRGDE